MNKQLQNAVIRQLGGRESLQDVLRGGADAGFHGFCYYSDTLAFYRRQRKNIVALAEEMARELGENVLDMVSNFRCLNGDFSSTEVARVLYGKWADDDAHTAIGNALAWFALEETARELCDN